jgi:hypothetical protein
MLAKMMSFLYSWQLRKIHHFGEHDKQIFGPSCFVRALKSEVAIASLFCQTKQPKTFLLQVKTITKLPGIGIAESVKSCNLQQKGSFKA